MTLIDLKHNFVQRFDRLTVSVIFFFDSATRQLHQLEEERKKIMQQIQQKDLKINGTVFRFFNLLQLEIHACSNPSPYHDKVLTNILQFSREQTIFLSATVHPQLQATVNILVLLYFSIQ